jgi:hypothetical protein
MGSLRSTTATPGAALRAFKRLAILSSFPVGEGVVIDFDYDDNHESDYNNESDREVFETA